MIFSKRLFLLQSTNKKGWNLLHRNILKKTKYSEHNFFIHKLIWVEGFKSFKSFKRSIKNRSELHFLILLTVSRFQLVEANHRIFSQKFVEIEALLRS